MKSFYIICFDVSNEKRLRKVAIQLENFGTRIQYSLFECHLSPKNIAFLKHRLEKIIDPQADHIRYYKLCPKDKHKVHIEGWGELTPDKDYYMQ